MFISYWFCCWFCRKCCIIRFYYGRLHVWRSKTKTMPDFSVIIVVILHISIGATQQTHTRAQHLHLQNNNCSHLSATSYCYFPHHIIQWSCKVVQIKHISPYLTLSFCSTLFRFHFFLQTVAMHSFWSIRCEPLFSSPYFSFSVFNLILIICLLCLCYCECENFLFNQKFALSVELCLCLGTKNTHEENVELPWLPLNNWWIEHFK